ncbi:MAG TPA: M20/M25/M40 family metallo-hydrolase [Thermoanaerobaculia bacterium]|nr:M20/M25/M40 family metallo-hydrolase [Thermoanaerobaculia bacterium]
MQSNRHPSDRATRPPELAQPRTRLRGPSLWVLGGLCGAAALGALPAAAQEANLPPERYREMGREALAELIEIDTTHSAGDNTAAAQAMADRLLAAGFPAGDVRVIEAAPRKGNLVARLRGSDPELDPMLLLAHIDVVEAHPEDWTVEPFTFLERDGYWYGRGTTDDKDEAAIHTVNLIRLKEEGFVPARDIVVALTADEEGGPHNGVQYLLEHHRDLIDAAFALNEGGGGVLQGGRRISNNVQASEKLYQSFHFEATNPGGHSSLPRADNAIYELARALTRISEHQFPVMLNEVTRAFFERTAELVDPQTGAAMRGILGPSPDPEAVALLEKTPAFASRMRTTCVATELAGGHAPNALPQRATATVNCRIAPGHDPLEVLGTLEEVAAEPTVSITPDAEATPSPPSPLTDEVFGAIERITEQMWPGVPVIPTMSAGATDGLYLRNAGIPVYGASGLFQEVDDVRAHGRDERIRIEDFDQGMEFLYRLTKELAGGS